AMGVWFVWVIVTCVLSEGIFCGNDCRSTLITEIAGDVAIAGAEEQWNPRSGAEHTAHLPAGDNLINHPTFVCQALSLSQWELVHQGHDKRLRHVTERRGLVSLPFIGRNHPQSAAPCPSVGLDPVGTGQQL